MCTLPNQWANSAMIAKTQQHTYQMQLADAVQMQAHAWAAPQLQASQSHVVQAGHAQVDAQVQTTQGKCYWNEDFKC